MKRVKSSSFSVRLEITDPDAARVLTDTAQLRYFAPFIARDCTVNQVALETGCKPNTMYARVQRYLKLGLLRIVRQESRDGRAIKLYRSIADELIVPMMDFSYEAAQGSWSRFFERAMAKGMQYAYAARPNPWRVRYFRDANGVFTNGLEGDAPDEMLLSLGPNDPAVLNTMHDSVYLSFEDAKAFQHELSRLTQTYFFSRSGGQRYLVRLNLVPVPEEAEVIP